jgi:hypothetical protein
MNIRDRIKKILKEENLPIFEEDSFDIFMKRRYFKLEEDLLKELDETKTNVCDIRLSMYINYISGNVADSYMNRDHEKWHRLYDFLKRAFKDRIEEDYFKKVKGCK